MAEPSPLAPAVLVAHQLVVQRAGGVSASMAQESLGLLGGLLLGPLDFAVGVGECIALTGANGSGKSSLLATLAGALPPAAGQIRWESTSCWMVGGVHEDLTVGAELRFWRQISPTPPIQSIAELCAQLQLAPDWKCRTLSSGQKQRVLLARVICSGAQCWLLDEPETALDAATQLWLRQTVAAHCEQGGSVIWATHSTTVPCDRRLHLAG